MQLRLSPQHTRGQREAEDDDVQNGQDALKEQAELRNDRIGGVHAMNTCETVQPRVVESDGAVWHEEENAVVEQVEGEDGRDGQVVNEKSPLGGAQPLIVKHEDVPFDCGQGEEHQLAIVHRVVDERPDQGERGRLKQCVSKIVIMTGPQDIGQFEEQAEQENDDDDVIVKRFAQSAIEQVMVEQKDRAENRESVGND